MVTAAQLHGLIRSFCYHLSFQDIVDLANARRSSSNLDPEVEDACLDMWLNAFVLEAPSL